MRLAPGVAAAGMAALVLAPATVASAAPEELGSLVVSPSTGDLDTAIDLLTDGECTRGTTFVVTLDGRGLSEGRGNLVGATKIDSLGLPRYPGFHEVPVAVTLREYLLRSLDRPRLAGDYTLTFVCRNTLDTEPLQVFTGDISVAQDGTFAAVGDSAREIRDVVGADLYDRVEEAEQIARDTEMDEPAPDPNSPESEASVPSSATQPADDAGVMTWLRPVLIVAGLVLLGGVALAMAMSWARTRGVEEGRRAARAEDDSETEPERADSPA